MKHALLVAFLGLAGCATTSTAVMPPAPVAVVPSPPTCPKTLPTEVGDDATKWLGEEVGAKTTRNGMLRLFPHKHDTDGFFGVVLVKAGK